MAHAQVPKECDASRARLDMPTHCFAGSGFHSTIQILGKIRDNSRHSAERCSLLARMSLDFFFTRLRLSVFSCATSSSLSCSRLRREKTDSRNRVKKKSKDILSNIFFLCAEYRELFSNLSEYLDGRSGTHYLQKQCVGLWRRARLASHSFGTCAWL